MVINEDRRKAIFVHIPKTGGVSVERSIHKALGGDDYIAYQKLIRVLPRENVKTCRGLGLHSTLRDYRRYYGPLVNDFYKFSIVRNPWRRMVSHYEYLLIPGWNKRMNEKNKMTFSQFIQISKTHQLGYSMPTGYDEFLADDYSTEMDYVFKLENINEDLPKVGLGCKLEITDVLHFNSTNAELKEHDNWRDYYNPGLRDLVYKIYEKDIKKFDYEFEEV